MRRACSVHTRSRSETPDAARCRRLSIAVQQLAKERDERSQSARIWATSSTLRLSSAFRNDVPLRFACMERIAIPLDATPDELKMWGRAAALARLELDEWVHRALADASAAPRTAVVSPSTASASLVPLGTWRPCIQCGRPLPLGSTARRRTCSDACRLRAYRRRRAGVPEGTDVGSRGRKLGLGRERGRPGSPVIS